MLFLIGFLTVVMVLVCVFLVMLVLMQLPKKEAGAGLAFGGAATDALFGAGSGNFLTKATKYAAITFFVLAVLISWMQNSYSNRHISEFQQNLNNPQNLPVLEQAPPPAAMTNTPAAAPATNGNGFKLLNTPATSNTAPASK